MCVLCVGVMYVVVDLVHSVTFSQVQYNLVYSIFVASNVPSCFMQIVRTNVAIVFNTIFCE